jgi:hypothetical protein
MRGTPIDISGLEISFESRPLDALSTKIVSAHKLVTMPGLKPIILEVGDTDRAELRHWSKILAVKAGLDPYSRLLTAAQFEASIENNVSAGDCVLITDGENISSDLQRRIIERRPLKMLPLSFIVLTTVDPLIHTRSGIWSDEFRACFAFAADRRWPTINERRRDWTAIFRAAIKALERQEKTPKELNEERAATRITSTALEKLRTFSFSADEGSAAIIQIAADAYDLMRRREDPCIMEAHLRDRLLVRRPSSFPPSSEAIAALH